jgi:two-component system sensor histidine kinase TctE
VNPGARPDAGPDLHAVPPAGTRTGHPPGLFHRWLARPWATRSLHRQLLLWLLLPQLVLWLAGAAFTYEVAARYARGGIDASLLQATRSLARQVKPIGNGLFIDFPRAAQDIIEADPDDRVQYMVSTPPGQFILGNARLPLPPEATSPAGAAAPRLNEPYFYDAALDGVRLRLAALYVPIGEPSSDPTVAPASRQVMLVQIARSQASRDELAQRILRDTVLPLSVVIVLMTMIVWAGIRAGLAPLARLRALVENRGPNDLAPLELQAAPEEVRALAGAVNQLLGEVQQSVAGQRRFISNAAHQLRTPLAGLKSQTEIAIDATTDPALRARLQRVHESAVRSAHLVNQLLTLTRAEPEAASALPRTRVDLLALVTEVTSEHVPRALQAGVDLGLADPESDHAHEAGAGPSRPPTRVQGAAVLLREAVANLIDNAIRYAGRGSEVTVSVAQEGDEAVVEVADNGPGIPAEQQALVFNRFFRATSEGPGCGLGLAIVREIAERHGGSARLRPHAGPGLCVQLRLPLDKG